MPFGLRNDCSLEVLIELSVYWQAGCMAYPAFADEGSTFETLRGTLREARDLRDDDSAKNLTLSAQVRVAHLLWLAEAKALATRLLLLAQNQRSQEPYLSTYGAVSINQIRSAGAAKAIGYAENLLQRCQTLGVDSALTKPFSEATANLRALHEARGKAQLARQQHTIKRAALVKEVVLLVTQVEARLLTKAPAEKALIKAVLAGPERTTKTKEAPTA